jgi:hypothetical protein
LLLRGFPLGEEPSYSLRVTRCFCVREEVLTGLAGQLVVFIQPTKEVLVGVDGYPIGCQLAEV